MKKMLLLTILFIAVPSFFIFNIKEEEKVEENLLVFEEKELLYSIVKNTNEVQCKVGALLLLDEQQEAEKYLGLMDPEEIEQFQSYPVYAFYSVT